MKGFVVQQAARFVVGVLGAILVATAIAALGEPSAHTLPGFGMAFLARLWQYLHGNLGLSVISGLPVATDLAARLPATLLLLLMGLGVALAAGLPLGALVAFGKARKVAAPLIQIITATPVFCGGLALAYLAVHGLNWPVSINTPIGAAIPPDQFWQITALPVLTIGLAGAAAIQLALRRASAHASSETFRTGLKRMGLSAIEIETLYVVPQVIGGLLSSAGEIMLSLLSATVVAEWVFHRAGAADLFVKSVALADWNMAAILLFVFASLTFTAEFIGKLLGHVLAPRGAS